MQFNKPIYRVDWRTLTSWLIPMVLRKPKMLAWLNAATSSINDLHARFITYKNYTAYRLSITPQVCYLERALNDRYDFTARRIRIVDGVEYAGLPLFLKVEGKALKLRFKSEGGRIAFFTKSETGVFTVDFVVQVPRSIVIDENEIKAFVNSYKLASKIFTIQKV